MSRTSVAIALVLALLAGPAAAQSCGDGPGGFNAWLAAFKQRAERQGIGADTLERAFAGVTYSSRIIALDRDQRSFKRSFEDFYRRRVDQAMINRARKYMRDNAAMLGRIEDRYGVPAALVVAIWGLETAFGRHMGDLPIIRSLATLSYDCRRSEFFTRELLAALTILDRRDMRLEDMRGAWAGEIGQTQFLAERYVCCAVDFDGDGRRDLVRSTPDALASTANWFRRNGWRPGAPWGPGTANYNVIGEWNQATVYQQTIARLAEELAN
jgi:lytic murein transglycosylase